MKRLMLKWSNLEPFQRFFIRITIIMCLTMLIEVSGIVVTRPFIGLIVSCVGISLAIVTFVRFGVENETEESNEE